jgi:hypothetical protein
VAGRARRVLKWWFLHICLVRAESLQLGKAASSPEPGRFGTSRRIPLRAGRCALKLEDGQVTLGPLAPVAAATRGVREPSSRLSA